MACYSQAVAHPSDRHSGHAFGFSARNQDQVFFENTPKQVDNRSPNELSNKQGHILPQYIEALQSKVKRLHGRPIQNWRRNEAAYRIVELLFSHQPLLGAVPKQS
jgi:hypothetical protein